MPIKSSQKYNEAPRYGIHEWYGTPISNISEEKRKEYADIEGLSGKPCPFLQDAYPGHACNKVGGCCSIRYREYVLDAEGYKPGSGEPPVREVGIPAITCPNRFFEDNTLFKELGKVLFKKSSGVDVITEVQFLNGTPSRRLDALDADWKRKKKTKATKVFQHSMDLGEDLPPLLDEDGKPVGRLDMVVMNADNHAEWSPVEIQAVYFSGDNMASHAKQHGKEGTGNALPLPDKSRRPDFRSSGLKRLMPQMMVKIPKLRPWGKKMVIVVDRRFFANLADMTEGEEISGAEIIWFVVDYDAMGKLVKHEIVFTTMADAVVGLTAGKAMPKEAFEDKLLKALANTNPNPLTFKSKSFRA